MSRRFWRPALLVTISIVGARNAEALSIRESNIVDLLRESNDIVVGQVRSVTDGIDERGIPYTEVTLDIEETIRGNLQGTYTFRQFGLREPRPTADGTMMMMPAPDGFPRYTAGQTHLLFLHPAAKWTGLRTTARLGYGKFNVGPGRVENDMANAGLFRNVRLEHGLVTASERRMMAADGAANPDSFLTFVKRAVRERWVETGRMAHAQGAR
jgi:hypothetical protein